MAGIWEAFAAELTGSFTATPAGVAALRLLAAMLLGGVIGLERELQDKAAGLRTHMLIALAACLYALIALELIALPGPEPAEQRTDILRLIEAVTAGVAFLAAGSIIVAGGHVKGLTTGAGMWMAGAAGLACGTGHAGLAVMASVLAVVVLWLFKRLSARIGS